MIEEIVLRSACLVNESKFWDGPTIAAFVATGVAFLTFLVTFWQARVNEQQKDIALYKERYENIYKLILDTISKEKDLYMVKYDDDKRKKISRYFLSKIDYARFLVKEKDFDLIMNLHQKICNLLISYYSRYYNILKKISEKELFKTNEEKLLNKQRIEEIFKIDEKVKNIESKILKIILPYLQIEKEVRYKRIFYWMKNLFKKQKND